MKALDRAIEVVMLAYPSGYRSARGREIQDALVEMSEQSSRLTVWRHLLSMGLHGWRTRVQVATDGKPSEFLRQGALAAVLVVLAGALVDARGWDGWPYVFATGLLLAGAWGFLADVPVPIRIASVAAIIVAGHEFYGPQQTLPLVGEFSLPIVVLVCAMKPLLQGRRPGRSLAAVVCLGLAFTWVTGPSASSLAGISALAGVGVLAAAFDPRAAVAVVLGVPLAFLVRLDWLLTSGPVAFSPFMLVTVAVALGLLFFALVDRRWDSPGHR